MRISTRTASVIALAAALGLAACSKEQPANALDENAMAEAPIENTVAVNLATEAPPVVGPLNDSNSIAAPPPAFTDKEQIRDDADATGMTARLPAGDMGAPPANETQPAQ